MKTKSVIYARVSTDLQQTKSQIEDLQKYADDNNFEVVKIFDESISGFTEVRDELSNLKSFVKENNIKQILCYELSRLGRSTRQTLNEIDYFSKEGINIFLKKDNLNTLGGTATDKLLLNILSSISELEVSTFKERSARGRLSGRLKGRTNGIQNVPYGYSLGEHNTLIINDIESKNIEKIFDLAIKGTSLYGICQYLNSTGVKTKRVASKGKSVWVPKVVRTILKNTLYKGIKDYKGHIISVPQIVSEETWSKVQERFVNSIQYRNSSIYPYLFKGKLRCGVCGRSWVSYTKKSGYGFYFCSNGSLIKGKCENNRYVSTSLLDKNLFTALFQQRDTIENILSGEMLKTKKEELETQIEFYKSELENVEAKSKRVNKAFINGNLPEEEYDKELTSLKKSIIDFKNKIKVNEQMLKYEPDTNLSDLITSIYKNDDYNMKREIVVKYVDKVEMFYLKNSNIVWDNPLRKDDKIIYAKMNVFNCAPIHIVFTTHTKQLNIYSIDDVSHLGLSV